MIAVINRFHGHGSLRYVYKNGYAIRSHPLSIKYCKNPHRKHSRFAVVVSKKVHKRAVGRNRMRRKIYEIIRQENVKFNNTYDVAVMIFSDEVILQTHDELVAHVRQLFTTAGFYSS